MTGDPLKPLKPGGEFPTSAKTWNPVLELARTRTLSVPSGTGPDRGPFQILIRNDSGADLDRQAPVSLNGSVVLAADGLLQFRSQPILIAETPSDSHMEKLAITTEPIAAGAIGRAIVSGHVVVQVDLADDETHAGPIAGDATKLGGGTSGHLILYRPPDNGVQWCVVLLGSNGSGFCSDPAEFTVRTLEEVTGNRLGFFDEHISIWINGDGCIETSQWTESTGRYVALCCSQPSLGSSASSCLSDAGSLRYAITCDGSGLGGTIGYQSPFRSYKGYYHEIISIVSDKATIVDGDLVTITTTWKLRDDYPYDSLNNQEACCGSAHPDGAGCGRVTLMATTGCAVTLVSTTQDDPTCLRHGETYTYATTYRVEFLGDGCTWRGLSFRIAVGLSNHTGHANRFCSVYPGTGSIHFNSDAGGVTCPTPSYFTGPWGEWLCAESSSSGSGSGSGPSSASSSGPSLSL